MTRLQEQIRRLDERRVAFDIVDAEYEDAAYVAVQAAELEVRATLLAARAARGISTITPEEAAELRAVLVTGGVVA